MGYLQWSASLDIKIADIDTQHMKLVDIINSLYDAMREGKGKTVLETILDEMADYSVVHFTYEEKILSDNGYPELGRHKFQHDDFVNKVKQFKREFASGKMLVSIEVLNFLRDWLISHIADSDKKYAVYLTEKGVK
ncbi:MAG: hemerythrin [Spirochaetes bacterium GWF1_49_6]|nr:MAG: hemerythrin [Spirochaetes bacterium GWF1_49_6]